MNTSKNIWDLGLLYKNEHDPQIEKDLKITEKICADFEKQYRKADFTLSPEKLAKAMVDYEKLLDVIDHKPWWYFALQQCIDSSNTVVQAKATKYKQRITTALNKIKFFKLKISQIPKSEHKKYLKSKALASYAYSLSRIFKSALHELPENENQLLHLLTDTSYSMWVTGQSKLLQSQMVSHNGSMIPITEAMAILPSLPTKERRKLHTTIHNTFKSIAHFAEAEINAVYNYKQVVDTRKKYKEPYSETIEDNENDEKNITMLVDLVTKHFSISKRFYKLHAKLLKEEKLEYADRFAGIGEVKSKFNFDSSVQLVKETFDAIDPQFGDILSRYINNGQIDIYPRKGKNNGAFCWGSGQLPIFVLLNHTDNIRSVETLAHEMGHAIHTELSNPQPAHYRDYSMAVAEVASTFFEQAVIEKLESVLPKDEQIILLHNKILGDINTVFRQIACFNFETELHRAIRNTGQLSHEEIATLLQKHMQSYMGDTVTVTELDGYQFVSWSHIRRFFYVYSYAYGQLISRSLYTKWKENPTYSQKIKQFLASGSSKSPEDIFKSIGIKTDENFFLAGIKSIEEDIKRLEKMVKKTK